MVINDESLRGPRGGHQESGHGERSNTLTEQLSICLSVCVSHYTVQACESGSLRIRDRRSFVQQSVINLLANQSD